MSHPPNGFEDITIPHQKRIAVITPVHNDEKHILNAINSVKSQNKNTIHFIYDDNSTDSTHEIIQQQIEQQNPTICLITGDKRVGQSTGRNILIKLALQQGFDYIAFLDSDDIWHNYHLQQNIAKLEEENVDVVYSKPVFKDEQNNTVFFNFFVPHIFIGKQLERANFIHISSVVLKSQVLANNEFDSTLDGLEDWDLWLRLWRQNYKFCYNTNKTLDYLMKANGQAGKGGNKTDLVRIKHNLVRSKENPNMPNVVPLKLNIACGGDYRDGYINADLYPTGKVDAVFDVAKIPYDDGSICELCASHVIEHFHFFETTEVLKEWYRVLIPGGKLIIETPDFLESCRAFVNGTEEFRVMLYGHFFAMPWILGQTHKFLFTETQLRTQLKWAGFSGEAKRIPPISNYVRPDTYNLFLAMEVVK